MARSRFRLAGLLALLLAAAPARGAEPSATTMVLEIHNARMMLRLKGWIQRYAEQHAQLPPSIGALVRQMPEPDFGVAWLWLIDRGQSQDFDFLATFASGSYAVAARPKRKDSGLSLYLASEGQQLLQGGDAGRDLGDSSLPVLDQRAAERRLGQVLTGPGDLDMLLRLQILREAQEVLRIRTGSSACSFAELDAARAAGQRLAPVGLDQGDAYFELSLLGTPDESGKCEHWLLRAASKLPSFPSYEMSASTIWVVPTDGPKRGLRIFLDQYQRP